MQLGVLVTLVFLVSTAALMGIFVMILAPIGIGRRTRSKSGSARRPECVRRRARRRIDAARTNPTDRCPTSTGSRARH